MITISFKENVRIEKQTFELLEENVLFSKNW